jgi:tRNA threonylcarbamoyladenosine biosynthesis protein TsaE
MEIKTTSPTQTQKVAKDLAKTLTGGDVVALFGDLGAGKTTFVQGLAHGLGIKRKITSPTFVFMRLYPFVKNKIEMTFYHIDLYRGEEKADFDALGLDEIFSPDSIVVLEWAQKLENFLPKMRINVKIETIDTKTRRINVKRAG